MSSIDNRRPARRALRITIVNQHRDDMLCGSEVQCDMIARGLGRRGHAIRYVAPLGKRDGRQYQSPYEVVPVAYDRAAIAKAIRDGTPDIVYWRFNTNGLLQVSHALHKARIPVVFAVSHIRDTKRWAWDPWRPSLALRLKELLRSRIEHEGFRYVSAVTCLSRDYMGRISGPPEYFVPDAMTDAATPFHWPRPYCVWIANLKPQKRPEAFVKLASSLESSGLDFLMFGAMHESYKWIAEKTGTLPSNFHYLGVVSPEEISGALAGSLFHVHTCVPEGFGNVFLQAWLQARPTLSLGFDPGGCIRAQGLGYCVDDDWPLFESRARDLFRDAGMRREMGDRARAFAAANFGEEPLLDNVESILLKIADR